MQAQRTTAQEPWREPHHDGSAAYVSDPAPAYGDVVSVFLRAPHVAGVERPWVRVVEDGEPRFVATTVDRRTEHETWFRAELPIHNPLTSYRWLLDNGPSRYGWLTGAGGFDRDVTDASDFKLSAYPPPPRWAADAIVYQIFPDRFAKAVDRPTPDWAIRTGWDEPVAGTLPDAPRQLYGGDLDGIAEHLDHIESVGANVVYLTPVFPAESNHRYNATSFDHVDPLLGGDAAMARLTRAVHARGMRLLGDLTTNHSGDTHEWFRTAQTDADSPESGFFLFGSGPDDYASWQGYRSLPKFDHTNPELRRRLYEGPDSVVARWLQGPDGLDGWRIDVANMSGRYGSTDVNRDMARAIRQTLDEAHEDALLIAEHCHDFSADLTGEGWHGSMNYAGFARPVNCWLTPAARSAGAHPHQPPRLPGPAIVATMRAYAGAVPWRVGQHHFTLLGSHDTPRVRTSLGDPRLVAVGLGLLATMPGIPMLFAGDEIGLTGTNGEDARQPFPWDRTRWDETTLSTCRRMFGVRREQPALRSGGLRWLYVDDDVLVFLREAAGGSVLVQAARAPHEPCRLPAMALGSAPRATPDGGALPGLAGTPDVTFRDDTLTLPDDGPAIRLWLVPETL